MDRISSHRYTNALIGESSPYLLQHAHNPVNWYPWGEAAFDLALKENKPIIVSIGYSSCHWCHVMENESFEDLEVARVMNRNFVCIKVDREERPDVDQVFMDALQLMRKQGGWPLNCVTTPDRKPVFGGTYFPKQNWIAVLTQLSELWKSEPEKFKDYGDNLAQAMQVKGGLPLTTDNSFTLNLLTDAVSGWKNRMDHQRGGPDKAPKFPLPVNYRFLLNYGVLRSDGEVINHTQLTLDRMALGGIYDQVEGGFARYSTDAEWKVPHFEKMLYDNAQLIGLYAEGYRHFRKTDYLRVIRQTDQWLQTWMHNGSGGYFSAVDADSESEEGKYYVFTNKELHDSGLFEPFTRFYESGQRGIWENKLIPVRIDTLEAAGKRLDISTEDAQHELETLNEQLKRLRKPKVKPGLDDKTICSWNALLATGYYTTSLHTGNREYINTADQILDFIDAHMCSPEDGSLFHTWKNGKTGTVGFLEDYAFLIEALLKKLELKFDEATATRAKSLANLAIDHYYDTESGLFYMNSDSGSDLPARPVELNDNVMPSGNTTMAGNLIKLDILFGIPRYREIAERIIHALKKNIREYPEGCGLAASIWLTYAIGAPELIVTGPDASEFFGELNQFDFPGLFKAWTTKDLKLPIFAGRTDAEKTHIYICQNKACQRPLYAVSDAVKELKKIKAEIENR